MECWTTGSALDGCTAGASGPGTGVGAGSGPEPELAQCHNAGPSDLEIAPWMAMAPGAALVFTVLGFNFLGDGVRDALDHRLKQLQ
jgi:ABC-type dipeptide/oligopeptide/nickel transport system permease subunit